VCRDRLEGAHSHGVLLSLYAAGGVQTNAKLRESVGASSTVGARVREHRERGLVQTLAAVGRTHDLDVYLTEEGASVARRLSAAYVTMGLGGGGMEGDAAARGGAQLRHPDVPAGGRSPEEDEPREGRHEIQRGRREEGGVAREARADKGREGGAGGGSRTSSA
jgi:hypothetical protein